MSLTHHLSPTSGLWRIVGGTLLVSGTCIGAGMLSLPVITASSGLENALCSFLGVWLIMTFTALVMLEVSLAFPEETNLISMARATFGNKGAIVGWLTYVLFLYSIMAAYTSSGSHLAHAALVALSGVALPAFFVTLLYTVSFALVIYIGARWVDYLNRLMMIGLIGAYLLLVALVIPKLDIEQYLFNQHPSHVVATLPILVTSFGFHLLIPSLKTYLRSHVKQLRFAIIAGSLIPLIVYIIWVLVIQGVIPAVDLIDMIDAGEPVVPMTQKLDMLLGNPWISRTTRLFSFFAIVSSFMGVSLGLFDFFADGLHLKKNTQGKLKLIVYTFLPPVVFVYLYPEGFLMALGFAGIFAAILLVLFPVTMAYRIRYGLTKLLPYQVTGGKIGLIAGMLFGVMVIGLELFNRI